MPKMTPSERKFFIVLDQELDKVQAFYEERETEALERYKVLREQLEQLAQHREQYIAQQTKLSRFKPAFLPHTSDFLKSAGGAKASDKNNNTQQVSDDGDTNSSAVPVAEVTSNADGSKKTVGLDLSPEHYIAARRKLKVAMWEFYRFLGYVKNYRLLNRTGFSKVTKKMEKVTRIKCQNEYTNKVSKTPFATSNVIDDLQSETETLFGVNFEKGSRKKAVQRLRFMGATTTHHFASWRAGVMLGAALPPLVDGIVRACHSDTRARIPGTETRTLRFSCLRFLFFCVGGQD